MADKISTIENLTSFVDVLSENNIVKDPSPLYELIAGLRRSTPERGLGYRLDRLEFNNVATNQFIRSDKWDGASFLVQLNLEIAINSHGVFKFGDVKTSVVEIVFEALSEETTNYSRGAWHLDYHAFEEPTEFIHPSYHFHFGGRRIKESIDNYGDIIILDAPRVMHPPLDLFLAVDFLVTNFLEQRAWQALRADTRYKSMIKDAQNNWWKDYFQQIAEYWGQADNQANQLIVQNKAKLSNPHLI